MVAAALVGAACADATAKTEKKGRRMSKTTSTNVLDRLDELAKQRPFRPEAVSQLVGLPLEPVTAASNAYFTIYRSPAGQHAAPFAAVELRAPTGRNKKDGLVIVDIETDCLKLADVGERWGKPEWTGPNPPEMPRDRPEYYAFKQPWGVLRLGFSRETRCLVAAVIDAT